MQLALLFLLASSIFAAEYPERTKPMKRAKRRAPVHIQVDTPTDNAIMETDDLDILGMSFKALTISKSKEYPSDPSDSKQLREYTDATMNAHLDGLFGDIKTAKTDAMCEAIEQDDWTAFERATAGGIEDVSMSMKRYCLSEAIDRRMASFVRKMLENPLFREALGSDLTDFAAKSPNTLWALATVDFKEGEAEFLKDEQNILGLIKYSLANMYPLTRKIILEKLGYQTDYVINRVMILDPTKATDDIEFYIGELASRYFSDSYGSQTNAFLSGTSQIAGFCKRLVNALRKCDFNSIKYILTSDMTPRVDDFILLMLDYALMTQDLQLIDMIGNLRHNFKKLNLPNLLNIIQNTIRLGHGQKVGSILARREPDAQTDYYLTKGFMGELIESGDLATISMLSPDDRTLGKRFYVPIRLAQAAYMGIINFVICFMEHYPHMLILSDAAWDTMFEQYPGLVLNMIKNIRK